MPFVVNNNFHTGVCAAFYILYIFHEGLVEQNKKININSIPLVYAYALNTSHNSISWKMLLKHRFGIISH